jgi:deoxyribodipyrimidine photo-lyase
VRQLCWRDYRSRGDRWSRSEQVFEAWKEGRTGYPLVDAGMRQLAAEGYMHNRARLTVGSFSPRTSTSTGARAPCTSGTC